MKINRAAARCLALVIGTASGLGILDTGGRAATASRPPIYTPAFRPVTSGAGFVLANGARALIVKTNSDGYLATGATLVDDQDQTRTVIPVTFGCTPGALGPSAIVSACQGDHTSPTLVYHIASQTTTPSDGAGVAVRAGTDWAELQQAGDAPHSPGSVSFINLKTGAVVPDFQRIGGREYADLDDPALRHKTCAPVRVPAELDLHAQQYRPALLFFVHNTAIKTNLDNTGQIRLQRCGSRDTDSYPIGRPDAINAKMIMWAPKRGELEGMYLRSRQHFFMRLQRPLRHVIFQSFALTNDTLYAVVQGTLQVWQASLPRPVR